MNYVTKEIGDFINLLFYTNFLLGHNGFIAGGCFKNIFNKEKVKDIDIFFPSAEEYFKALKWYENPENKMTPFYENDKVKAFKTPAGLTIELVKVSYGDVRQTLDKFDFSIVKFAIYKEPRETENGTDYVFKILHHENFFEHLFLKRLVLEEKIEMPYGTFERLFRYAKYGYFPCKQSKLNLLNCIRSQATLTNDSLAKSLYTGLD